MERIEHILNNIYCLSQKAEKTLKSLKAYPEVINNPYQYELYILIRELQTYALETYNHYKQETMEDLKDCLDMLFTNGFSVGKVFTAFSTSIKLPAGSKLIKQLGNQIDSILAELGKLALLADEIEIVNGISYTNLSIASK